MNGKRKFARWVAWSSLCLSFGSLMVAVIGRVSEAIPIWLRMAWGTALGLSLMLVLLARRY